MSATNTNRLSSFDVTATSGVGHLYLNLVDTRDLLNIPEEVRFRLGYSLNMFNSAYGYAINIAGNAGTFSFEGKVLRFNNLSGAANPNTRGNGAVLTVNTDVI